MPGLASADPHTTTLSIVHVNGAAHVKSLEQMTLVESSRSTWPEHSMDLGRDMERMALIDQKAAEESLCRYCKPVELYNIIQRRTMIQPVFLQRCLSYKIQAAREKRTKMSIVALEPPGNNHEVFQRGEHKLHVFVMVTSTLQGLEKDQDDFRLSHTRLLTSEEEIMFLLPEIRKLNSHLKRDDYVILFVGLVDFNGNYQEPLASYRGHVLCGKLPLSTVYKGWMEQPNNVTATAGFSGNRVDILCDVDLEIGKLQHENFLDGRGIRFKRLPNGENLSSLPPLRLRISGEEAGQNSKLGNRFPNVEVPNGTCIQTVSNFRRRYGRVVFHYLYYFNKLRKIEATKNFSCPFCLVSCSSFKGLRCHLNSSHDLFNFEYLDTEDMQVVIVTCKNDISGLEGDMDSLHDPRLKNFSYCSNLGPLTKWRLRSVSRFYDGQTVGLQEVQMSTLAKGQVRNGMNSKTALVRKVPEHSTISTCTSAFGTAMDSNGQHFREVPLSLIDGCSSQKPLDVESQLRRQSEETGVHTEETTVASPSQQDPGARKELLKTASLSTRGFSLPLPKKRRAEKAVLGSIYLQTSAVDKSSGSVMHAAASPNGSGLLPPAKKLVRSSGQRVERSRKISSERAEARNRALLQKRQFYHSHTAQPMALEQLLSDKDSEDELDDAIASLEDRRMLDDFVDVTKDEKDLMHRWNKFIRRQRVIADSHCPWAFEAFTKLHAEDFYRSPSLRRCFMLMLVKFWNHHLIDGCVVNQCLSIVDSWEPQN